jgi:hypothetical protein
MRLALSVVVLSVLLYPSLLRAEVWRCPQDNGTDLFTNLPPESGNCENYVPSREVIAAPSSPTSSQDYRQESPTIPMPYAHDGPTPPEYAVPSYPDYYSSPYGYYSSPYYSPFYGGFFFRFRPGVRHTPGIRPHFGTPGGRPHFSTPGRSFRRR